MIKQTTPITTCIFDLHDVIVRKQYAAMVTHILKKWYRLDLVILLFRPLFIRTLTTLFLTSRVPEQYIVVLVEQYPQLYPFIDVIIAMMNEQIPIDNTITIIDELKMRGYRLYLFSNIGALTFQSLHKKYPRLLEAFDGFLTAEKEDDWIQKPYPQAFVKCIKRFNITPSETVFIDNAHKNINMARDFGFLTVLYKNPQQLRRALQHLHML